MARRSERARPGPPINTDGEWVVVHTTHSLCMLPRDRHDTRVHCYGSTARPFLAGTHRPDRFTNSCTKMCGDRRLTTQTCPSLGTRWKSSSGEPPSRYPDCPLADAVGSGFAERVLTMGHCTLRRLMDSSGDSGESVWRPASVATWREGVANEFRHSGSRKDSYTRGEFSSYRCLQ